METGDLLWSLGGKDSHGNRVQVAGAEWQPEGVCTDNKGYLYISDSGSDNDCVPRIVVVSVADGEVLQSYKPWGKDRFHQWDRLWDIFWVNPCFVVRKDNNILNKAIKPNERFTVTMFNVDEIQTPTQVHRESIMI